MPGRHKGTRQMELFPVQSEEAEHLRSEIRRLKSENVRLRTQNEAFVAEIVRLKQLVCADISENGSTKLKESKTFYNVTRHSSVKDKVALFRSYFNGREDVYAIRGTIDSIKTGKASYYPKRQYLGKVDGRMTWGDNLPLTDKVIRAHLQDKQNPIIVGIYPLLPDDTCWFLAIDFDKANWKADTTAFIDTCREWDVPAAIERSRSGNGGHIWIFFSEPVPARVARKLGSALLTYTISKRHEVGLDSYDRMFPNQDAMPRGKGLGNLIALPLQRVAGEKRNSLFIDEEYKPFPDQWLYLSSIRKMALPEVEAVVREANIDTPRRFFSTDSSFHSDPLSNLWPSQVKIVFADMLYVEKKGLSSQNIDSIKRVASFQNPEFYKAQALRLPTYKIPQVIDCSEEQDDFVVLPRGCLKGIENLLQASATEDETESKAEIEIEIDDKRNHGVPIEISFQGQLRLEQEDAVRCLLHHDIGVLSAATAFGKTVVGAYILAARAVNTLILVDKTQLADQWRERLSSFLNIPKEEIGLIGGGKRKRTGRIDVALFQSVYSNKEVKDFITDYGHVIVDECHHVSALSFERVMRKVRARYVLGLTATLVRKNGHHPIVLMQCGPVRYKSDQRAKSKLQSFQHIIIPRYTTFTLSGGPRGISSDAPISQLYDELIQYEARNDLIFDDLLKSLEEKRSPMLLTDRMAHLEYFANRLKRFAKNIIVLHGGMGKKQRAAIEEKIRSIPEDAERVILATGKYIGEGFDDARLDTLFLVMPISWKGTLQQYAGRLHRQYDSKRVVQIYDYVDANVPVFSKMYEKRLKGYRAMGYEEQRKE